MRVPEVLDVIKQMFSPNGYFSNGVKIKIAKPCKLTIDITSEGVLVNFADNALTVYAEKDLGIIKPHITRVVDSILFKDEEINIQVKNFPDFSINYS